MAALSYGSLEALLKDRLGESALRHSAAVADTAGLLATVYGVDVEHAKMAGLLHDWDKEVPPDELVDRARRLGIPVNDIDLKVPYLLHAHTGAADLAQLLPDLPGDVLRAIRRHTVGAPDMGDLDMVLYIADMIAPDRRYPGLDELRSLPGTVSLRDLFALCYQRSVEHLATRRKFIHPSTVTVWNVLVAREGE